MSDLLNRLVELHGPAFKSYVMEEETGAPKGHLLFLIDGTSMNSMAGLNTRLTDDCVVALMPPVGGG